MNIKAVREPVLNFVFNENGTTNKTRLSKKQTSNSKFAFRYIPKDYQLKLKQISSKQIIYTYSDKQKDPIYIKIQSNTAYDDYINQSNSDHYQELSVNGKKYYFLSGDQNSLIMYKRNHVFSIISSLPKSELLKIATNIKIIRNRK